MPRQFFPKQSGPHRIACITLYRALLSQCSRLELPSTTFRGAVNPIKHLIRKQFRRNQHVTSSFLTVTALKVGYEAEELLHSANEGDTAASLKVFNLVRDVQSEGDFDRSRPRQNDKCPKLLFRRPEPYPGAIPMLETRPRPVKELRGRRQVPTLVSANGLPFLRFKKPQSPFLSRVLYDTIKQKQKRLDGIGRFAQDMDWADGENEWENLVGLAMYEKPWQHDLKNVKWDVEHSIRKKDDVAKDIAGRMLKIVDEERRLFEEERKARNTEKSNKRKERWQSRSDKDSPDVNPLAESHKPSSDDSL